MHALMKPILLAIATLFFTVGSVKAQQPDSLIKKLDSLEIKADTVPQVNIINPASYNENTKITFPVYFYLLWSDLKQQLTSPFRGTKEDYYRFGGLIVTTAALSYADKPLQKNVIRWRESSTTVKTTSNYITKFGGVYEVVTLGTLGAYGYVFKNEKVKTTTLLATQSYITAGVIETALKVLTGRQRPNYIDPVTQRPSPTFHGPFYNTDNLYKSFPSGHTTAAFAAATVYAMEYRKQILVPIISYTAASLVGISRVVENKHWATDVLLGATLGYLCGRQVVNNYHRYAKLKTPGRDKGTMAFNVQYNSGHIQPGIIYKFK